MNTLTIKKIKNIFSKIFDPVYVFLFLIVAAVTMLCVYTRRQQTDTFVENADMSKLFSKEYDVAEGNIYTPVGDDPRLWLPCSDKSINMVTMKFSSPITDNHVARIYWATEETVWLNETNAFNISVPDGATVLDIIMPDKAKYTEIRFDYSGTFSLDSISFKIADIAVKTKLKFVPSAIVLIVSLVLGIFYTMNKRKLSAFLLSFFRFKHKIIKNKLSKLKPFFKPLYIAVFIAFMLTAVSSVKIHRDYTIIDGENVDLSAVIYENYEVIDNSYIMTDNDPKIFFEPTSTVFENVLIKFCEPLTYSGTAKLYYSIDGGFKDELFAMSKFKKDDKNILFEMPPNIEGSSLRLDLYGNFILEDIIIGNEYNSKINIRVDWIKLLIIITLLAVVVFASIKFSSKISYLKNKILDKPYLHSEEYLKKLSNFYLVLAVCFGTLIIFLSPPGSQTDETNHYKWTHAVSNFDFFVEVYEGQTGNFIRDDVLNLPFYRYPQDLGGFSYDKAVNLYNAEPSSNYTFVKRNIYSPIGHLISGLGIAAVRTLGLNLSAYTEAIIGKFCNLVFSSILIFKAIRKSKVLNNSMFLIGVMPMTLYQCASLSYDAVIIPCSMLFFAYLTKIYFAEKTYKITSDDIFSICFSAFFLLGAKSASYGTVIIILLAISLRKFGNVKKYLTCINVVIFIFIISYIVPFTINNNIFQSVGAVENDLEVQQKMYLLDNLNKVPDLVQNTMECGKKSYWLGFIGRLGWQTKYFVAYPFAILYSISLLVSFMCELCIIPNAKLGLRLLSLISSIITFTGTLFALYYGYSSKKIGIGTSIILGVQGRYFIPIALFVMVIFANSMLYRLKHIDKVMIVENQMVKIAGICACAITVFTLLTGYWIPM